MGETARHIFFPYNPDKATQAILWLLQKHQGALDKVKLVKLLFFADKEHLRHYGRPIVGGQYYAMPHGPTSSELLNHINAAAQTGPFILQNNRVSSRELPDKDELSESDIKVLDTIHRRYGHLNCWDLRNLTHLLAEYIKNWRKKEEGSRRHPIPYEDLLKHKKNKAMLDIIRDEQKAWVELV